MNNDEAEQTWSWLADAGLSSLDMSACITFVRGATQAQILSALRADPSVTLTYAEDSNRISYGNVVAVAPYGDGWVVIEENGWEGTSARTLHTLGEPGVVAAGLVWNINGVKGWSLVRDGVISVVDPWMPNEEGSTGTPPEDVLAAFAELDLMENDDVDPRPVGIREAARAAGLDLAPLPHASTLRFHPVPERRYTPGQRDLGMWALFAPHLLRRIIKAGAAAQRAIAAWALPLAMGDTDVAQDPRVSAALDAFLSGAPSFPAADDVVMELSNECRRRNALYPSKHGDDTLPWQLAAIYRLRAVIALKDASNPDAVEAALSAVTAAVGWLAVSDAEMYTAVNSMLDEFGAEPSRGVDETTFLLGYSSADPEVLARQQRGWRMAAGLEPDVPDLLPSSDQFDTLPAALAAWEGAWESRGAPVAEQLAPGASPDEVRTELQPPAGIDGTLAELWFGWHNGATSPLWVAVPASPGRLLSLQESVVERKKALAMIQEHEYLFPDGLAVANNPYWREGYVPLFAAPRGRTLGVDLETGLVWSGVHDAGLFPSLVCTERTLTDWVLEQVEALGRDESLAWTDRGWFDGAVHLADEYTGPDPAQLSHPTREDAAEPETVSQLAEELPSLLRAWEELWRASGLPEEGVLAPGLPPADVRERLVAQNLHVDPTLAEVWFGWHDGAIHEHFTSQVGPYRLLSLDESLNERAVIHGHILRILREGREMGQLVWSPHVLPLVQDYTAFGASSVCVDLATGRLWGGRWYSPSAGFHSDDGTINQFVADAIRRFDSRRTSWTDTGWTFRMDPDVP